MDIGGNQKKVFSTCSSMQRSGGWRYIGANQLGNNVEGDIII